MNRKEYERAQKLVDEIVAGTEGMSVNAAALRLRRMLIPPLTMQEILDRVPGETVTERAKAIGISRPHYYNLLGGTARRSGAVAKNLATLTGVPEAAIKEIW